MRAPLLLIDGLLEDLEQMSLDGREYLAGHPVLQRLERLSRDLRRRLPYAVRVARTPVDLHEALLDWQEHLLEHLRRSQEA